MQCASKQDIFEINILVLFWKYRSKFLDALYGGFQDNSLNLRMNELHYKIKTQDWVFRMSLLS